MGKLKRQKNANANANVEKKEDTQENKPDNTFKVIEKKITLSHL